MPTRAAAARALLLAAALAAAAAGAAAAAPEPSSGESPAPKPEAFFDHTLNTAGPACIKRFYNMAGSLYAPGSACPGLIQRAAAATAPDQCPEGAADIGSPLQRCFNATEAAIDAWVGFVTDCPVLRIEERRPGGLFSAAGPSCLPKFLSPQHFRSSYLDGPPVQIAVASAVSEAVRAGGAPLAAAAAAAAWAAAATVLLA
ncbi:hypothetical protein Rsub_03548 [Raphidocelis subcapitata]|uniref:Uncharacterized protein n=1 Tax=Raphidocelis subcapitata TaxID=307507 RepID=A0A2V0NU90_9CHLO|nr:hypothetical protein Rsub_03548 [Raphidocelis subcapitata]|eukprot:GBF91228.1 hypothetical protein Rsub_03548 [Raphidocelis subcapitata]